MDFAIEDVRVILFDQLRNQSASSAISSFDSFRGSRFAELIANSNDFDHYETVSVFNPSLYERAELVELNVPRKKGRSELSYAVFDERGSPLEV